MKTRTADALKTFGYDGSLEEFRTALTEIKAGHFAEWSTDELCFTRDEAAEFVQLFKKRLNAPKLTRVFVLRSLTNLRKARKHGSRTNRSTSGTR